MPGKMAVRRLAVWLYRALGAGLAMGVMEELARAGHQPLAQVPFVTSIVMTLAAPDSETARPYAVVAGHLLSSLAGVIALWCLGAGETAAAIAVGLAVLFMLAARALHPPAGIDGFLIAWLGLKLSWIADPVLIGALLLAGFSRLWAAGEPLVLRRVRPRGLRSGDRARR
jgi:CBS-domain-containing membrane protein